jgi:hypothetical protein
MSSRRTNKQPREEIDRISIESPASSDADLETGRPFGTRRHRSRSHGADCGPELERGRGRGSRRPDNPSGPDHTHNPTVLPQTYQRYIPGLSSYSSQAETIRPYDQGGVPCNPYYDFEIFTEDPDIRRKSPSPRFNSFSASQDTTVHDRAPSHGDNHHLSRAGEDSRRRTSRARHEERSRPRSRSRSRIPVASSIERQEGGSNPHLLRYLLPLRFPMWERTQWELLTRSSSLDDGKARHEQRRRRG